MKMWCRNNLSTVGKWGGASFVFGIALTAFMFVPIVSQSRILGFLEIGRGNHFAYAYVSDAITSDSPQPTELKFDLSPSINKISDVTLPVNDLINEAIKDLRFNQNLNIGTGIPVSPIKAPSEDIDFNKFFSSSTVSSGDITSFLKEAAITGINLSLLIISITTQVLKGLLEAIK